MDVATIFGQTLKSIRKEKRVSQEKLADECGRDRTFISLLERGKRQPSLSTILLIAQALDITAVELIAIVEREFREGQEN